MGEANRESGGAARGAASGIGRIEDISPSSGGELHAKVGVGVDDTAGGENSR